MSKYENGVKVTVYKKDLDQIARDKRQGLKLDPLTDCLVARAMKRQFKTENVDNVGFAKGRVNGQFYVFPARIEELISKYIRLQHNTDAMRDDLPVSFEMIPFDMSEGGIPKHPEDSV